jgi:hypothetical protein
VVVEVVFNRNRTKSDRRRKMKKTVFLVSLVLLAVIITACSKQEQPTNSNSATKPATANANQPAGTATQPAGKDDETPAAVKAAFPDAQTITKQHKDLTAGQIASIEKESGTKLGDTDFHNFVAYGMQNGKRAQLGAATVVDVTGAGEPMQLVVVYTNDIEIKKVTPVKGSGDVSTAAFLDQFVGKDHDLPFQVGKDIKYTGSNKAAAEAVTHALKRDILAMQTLYGKAHSH